MHKLDGKWLCSLGGFISRLRPAPRRCAHTAGQATLTKGPWYANNTRPAAHFQMSHCSPAGSCLTRSLWLHGLCIPHLLSFPSPVQQRRSVASGMARKRRQQEGARKGRWDKVSDELAYQPLLPFDKCYLGVARGDYQSLAWDAERLPVYNLLPGTNDLCKQANQSGDGAVPIGASALPSAVGWQQLDLSWEWTHIEGGIGWWETRVRQILYVFCIRGNDKCS